MKNTGAIKKIISLVLSCVMVVSVIPVIGVVFTPMAQAYSDYTKNYTTEYYYPAGTKFVTNFALYYSSKNANALNGIKSGVGFSSGSVFSGSYHTYIDSTNMAAYIEQDLNEGAGGDYVYIGFKLTTDPTAANACKATGIESNEFGNYNNSGSVSATVSGKTVTWWRQNQGDNATYNPKYTGDGAVDLNKGAGGKDMTLYATYDRSYGPAIDCFAVISTSDGESISATSGDSYFQGSPGWYTAVAINSPTNHPDLNRGAGGDYIYAYYHTPCSTVNSDRLREAYKYAKDCYENGGSEYSGLNSSLSAASAILEDLNDGYTTSTQAQIDKATLDIYDAMPVLNLNTEYTASINTATMRRYYKFTPSSTGTYVFFSYNPSGDTRGYLYNRNSTYGMVSSDTKAAYNDDNSNIKLQNLLGMGSQQFYFTVSLTANTTYYFYTDFYSSNTGSFPFKVCKGVDITFNATGGTTTFTQTLPSGHTMSMDKSGLSRDSHTLVAWSTSGSGAENKECLASDKVTIPASAKTYFALWYPLNAVALTPNNDYTAEIDATSEIEYYQFTPTETRKYLIYGLGSTDSYVLRYYADTYRSDGTYIDYQDDAGNASGNTTGFDFGQESSQFFMLRELTANTQYLYGVKLYSSSATGSVPFRFEPVFSVTYNANGGADAPAAQDKFVDKDIIITSAQPTRTGYDFKGWSTSPAATAPSYVSGHTYSANADLELFAVWTPAEYNVVLNKNGGSGGTDAVTATYDAEMPFAVMPSRADYTFAGYYDTNATSGGTQYYTADGDSARKWDKASASTLYARWNPNVTLSIGSGYTVTQQPASCVDYNGSTSFTITLSDGYTNSDVPAVTATNGTVTFSKSGNLITYTVSNITAPTTITLDNAALNTYTVTFLAEDDSVIEKQTVNHGSNATPPAAQTKAPDAAYHYDFNGWSGYMNITANTTIKASFTAVSHSEVTDPAVPATCTETGLTAGSHCAVCSYIISARQTTPASGHKYEFAGFDWSEDGTTAKAKLVCANDGSHIIYEDAAMSSVDNPATCTENASITYTATYKDETETNTVFFENTAKDHDYKFVGFDWSEDGTTAKAKLVCANDGSHIIYEDAAMSSVNNPATCMENASITYTATYKDKSETHTVVSENTAKGHDYEFDGFDWSEDYKTATAKFVCRNDSSHNRDENADVSISEQLAKCTESGKTIYTASVTFEDQTYIEEKEKVLPAAGHDYGSFASNGNGTHTKTCTRCEATVEGHAI
ncbi:MAG: InlB B-repeat-containing protein, partial [Oscillospiraceae bacterium]|nr:InlB B-repeat-containing protein [Oscillospiraceae bacterium]